MRILLAALILTLALAMPVEAGPDFARKAYRKATQADKRSKRALTHASAALAASRVVVKGLDGQDGAAGLAGLDGADGAQGPQGERGESGRDGTAGLGVFTTTNEADVRMGAVITTRPETVAALTVARSTDGLVLLNAEGQIESVPPNAGTPATATPITCELEADGATVESREFDLAAGATELVTISGAAPLATGSHRIAFICRRSSGVNEAVALIPAQRARLTTISG